MSTTILSSVRNVRAVWRDFHGRERFRCQTGLLGNLSRDGGRHCESTGTTGNSHRKAFPNVFASANLKARESKGNQHPEAPCRYYLYTLGPNEGATIDQRKGVDQSLTLSKCLRAMDWGAGGGGQTFQGMHPSAPLFRYSAGA